MASARDLRSCGGEEGRGGAQRHMDNAKRRGKRSDHRGVMSEDSTKE